MAALPAGFPPFRVVYAYHARWVKDGTLNQLHNVLREQVRLADGRHPRPSPPLVDSQSVRAAETVARSSRGFVRGPMNDPMLIIAGSRWWVSAVTI